MRTAYVNGEFVPLEDARISVLDRGFLFADGIYEVTAVLGGKLIDNGPHLERLQRSLAEIGLESPVTMDELTELQLQLVRRNGLSEGGVYLQITRGAAERDFGFPEGAKPSLVMFTMAKTLLANPMAEKGASVVTVPDLRWKRRDIKSVALLAQVLAKQEAARQGANEAWMVEDGFVTEGSSSTSFIVTMDGKIVTRPLSNAVLPGITRQAVMALAEKRGLTLEERAFTVEEAYEAAEAFLTSASTFVMPIVKIDNRTLSNGAPGPVARELRALYIEAALASAVG